MSVKFTPAVKAVIAAAVFAPLVAAAATPSTTLYGGGGTLAQVAYTGDSWLSTNGTTVNNPQLRLTDPADLGSLFGQFTATTPPKSLEETSYPAISYCAIGSGGGRGVFYGASGDLASNACGNYTATNKNGFSGTGDEPNFAGSDAPLASSEYTEFLTNKGSSNTEGPNHTEPVQIPVIAGAIAMAYNNSDITTQINLTESQICQVWSGAINNWDQLGSYPSRPIVLVYRSDNSGTAFNFSNHLSTVCPTAVPTAVTGFSTQSVFNLAFPGSTSTTVVTPAGSVAESGNGGIVTEVNATDGAIGFAEVADAVARIKYAGATVQFATVSIQPDVAALKGGAPGVTYHKWNPTSLGNRFTLPTGSVVADSVITGNNANGQPIVETVAAATGSAPPVPGCLFIVNPASIATAPTKQYSKVNKVGTTTYTEYKSYPIMAATYLLAYNTGNGADSMNIGELLASAYTGSGADDYNGVTTVGNNSTTGLVSAGYAYLSGVPAAFATTIKGCVKP